MPRPKNIILIMADQMAACHVNCYGSGVPSTPTLDALAARGTRLDRCYASSPVCTPSRAALITGRSPVASGMISNNYTMVSDTPTYAHVLRHHGYYIGGFGKFHLCPMPLEHPESYEYLGFDESVITEDPKWGAYTEWVRQEHPEHFEAALAVAWGRPRRSPCEAEPRYEWEALQAIRSRILAPLRQASPWGMFYTSPLPAELHQTTYITDLALDFMQRRLTGAADQPFFCFASYVDPHDPYDPPEPYARMFDPADMPEPIRAAWREQGNAVLENARTWLGFDQVARNVEIVKQLRAHYHGSIKLIDDQIARIATFLDEHGLWDDTIIVFTTDHGEMMGDHELIAKGVNPYDAGVRCPLIVAGGDVQSQIADRLICTLDFFPTFCDWAGIDAAARPPLEGRSFAHVCEGRDEPGPWPSVQVAFGPAESVISHDGWRLTLFADDGSPNQLINLRDEPTEQKNRYDDPACAEVRRSLYEELVSHHVRIRTTPQHRNLPIVDGQKVTPGGQGNGQLVSPVPVYCDPAKTPEW